MQKRGFAVSICWNDLPAATRVSIIRNSNSSTILIKTHLFNAVMKWRFGTISEQSIGTPRRLLRGRWRNKCQLHYITLHYITSHHITSHHITSHHITSHHITSHHITLHYITLHYIILHYITLNYIKLHYISTATSWDRWIKFNDVWHDVMTSRHHTNKKSITFLNSVTLKTMETQKESTF